MPKLTVLYASLTVIILGFVVYLSTNTINAFGDYKSELTSKKAASVPLTVLQTPERLFADMPMIKAIAASSESNKQIYAQRGDNGSIMVYDKGHKLSKTVLPFIQDTDEFTVGPQGILYFANTVTGRIQSFGPTGNALGSISTTLPTSLGVLSNGHIVSATMTGANTLHLLDQKGHSLKSLRPTKLLDANNPRQNSFLNKGKVLVGSSNTIYYVSQFTTKPTIERFSSEGRLLKDFPIKGDAVDIQTAMQARFLREKKNSKVGGFFVVTSASFDPRTGHLWVSLNGSSKTGIVYEYDSDGNKLHEYAFLLGDSSLSSGILTGVKQLIVRSPEIYVLTWQGEVFKFNTSNTSSVDLATLNQQIRCDGQPKSVGVTGWNQPALTSYAPAAKSSAALQLPCPVAQTYECSTNCPQENGVTVSCSDEIRSRLAASDRVISKTCTTNNETNTTYANCSQTVTACNTTTGVRVTHSVTLQCPPCPQGPGDACTNTERWNSHICMCEPRPSSPIVIDVLGDGFSLTDTSGGVAFDLDGDGINDKLSWTAVGSDDAWLALDHNGNGIIDNGGELFGNFSPQPQSSTPNGFLALAEYDKAEDGGNGDGIISSSDAIYSSLRLWQDTNHNGVSEPDELGTLPGSGMMSIGLDYKESKRTDQYGNQFRYRAKVRDAHGQKIGRWAYDVFLVQGL